MLHQIIFLIYLPLNQSNQFDFKLVLNKIYKLDVSSLIVEGGKKLTSAFLEARLFNEFFLLTRRDYDRFLLLIDL